MNNKELTEKAEKEMQACIENGDRENAHFDADGILCEVLKKLGYKKLVELYELVGKWYA